MKYNMPTLIPQRMLMRLRKYLLLTVTITLAATGVSRAAVLSFYFDDFIGDNTGDAPDLSKLVFVFNNENGDYNIIARATESDPFLGRFRLNINLFNPDTGTTSRFPGFFSDTLNDFDLMTSVTDVMLSGNDARLKFWQEGHRVAVGSSAFAPDGTIFGSGVIQNVNGGSSTGEDLFGTTQVTTGASSEFTTITVIPEPNACTLVALGCFSVAFSRSRRNAEGVPPNDR